MNPIESIGIIASIILIIPMLIPLRSNKQIILFRLLNNIACLAFIVYGFLLPAYATAICNIIVLTINIIYVIKLSLEMRKEK